MTKIIGITNSEIIFEVPSSRDGMHIVKYDMVMNAWECTCEHYHFRGAYCKHIQEAQQLFGELNAVMQHSKTTKRFIKTEEKAEA